MQRSSQFRLDMNTVVVRHALAIVGCRRKCARIRAATITLALGTALLASVREASAQSQVVGWGYNYYGQCNVPALPAGLAYVQVAGGGYHTVGRRSDGSVVAWGWNYSGQCDVPALPSGLSYVEIAGGEMHTVALRSDGSVVAWGSNVYGQCNVPALSPGLMYVQVTAADVHSAALRSDGSVVAFGYDGWGQCSVPPLPPGLSYVEISAGRQHSVGRRSDGSVIAWGDNVSGQCNVPALPIGLSYVQVSAGHLHTIARRSDGTAVAWGDNAYAQCNVPALPPGLHYIEVAASGFHTVALRNDGSVVAWGDNAEGQCNVPTIPNGLTYVGVAAGRYHTVARIEPAPPCPVPAVYCTAKSNSVGCTPSISYSGLPSFSGADNFHVTASNVLNNKFGAMLWSLDAGSAPFLGGTLCVKAPISRTPGQNAYGSPPPALDCTGTYSFFLSHSYLVGHLLPPGTQIYAQYWSRDKGFPSPNDVGLTDALAFVICP